MLYCRLAITVEIQYYRSGNTRLVEVRDEDMEGSVLISGFDLKLDCLISKRLREVMELAAVAAALRPDSNRAVDWP